MDSITSANGIQLTQIVGIALGSILLLAVAWVWVRKQVLGLGGFGMSLIGVILVSLNLWQSMKIQFSAEGVNVELRKIQERLDEAETGLASARQELANVELDNQALKSRVTELRQIATLQDNAYQQLQSELLSQDVIDERLLQPDLQRRLQQLQRP